MLKLASSLPYRLLKKHAGQPLIQEALVMGQASFLHDFSQDDYTSFLQKEYLYHQKKYGLKTALFSSEWQFMRVRPSNYPTVRLAQLSAILHYSPALFSNILHEITDLNSFKQYFDFQISSYWQYHYHFGKATTKQQNRALSTDMVSLLAINFMVPLWYAYGQFSDDVRWQEKCFDLLQEIAPEKNRITYKFEEYLWKADNAFDSQGMIGLYNNYCTKKKCLDCKIGQNLLRPQKM